MYIGSATTSLNERFTKISTSDRRTERQRQIGKRRPIVVHRPELRLNPVMKSGCISNAKTRLGHARIILFLIICMDAC